VRVTVKLFARLRDIAGTSDLVRQVPPGTTIRALWRDLAAEFTDFTAYERSISAAVNADYARMDDPLSDGDEVAFLPPVSGGDGQWELRIWTPGHNGQVTRWPNDQMTRF